jgi:hypothetical protein
MENFLLKTASTPISQSDITFTSHSEYGSKYLYYITLLLEAVTLEHYSLLMEGMLAQKVDRRQLQLVVASITPGSLEYHCAETLSTH